MLAPRRGQKIYADAASDAAGENAVDYDERQFASYKYLKLEYRTVLSVAVTPADTEAECGKTLQFTADVQGEGGFDPSVEWKVSGAADPATNIDQNGVLTVGERETAGSLTVTAVSVFDPEKSASAVVAVVPGSPADAGGGLPAGAVAAIAAGCAILAAAAAVVVWRIVKKKKTRN